MRLQRPARLLAITLALAAIATITTTVLTTTSGGAAPAVEHCVVRVTDIDPSGQMHLTDPACSSTRAAALRRVGLTEAALADWPIGVHYDGAGLTGSSLTVVGADCTGGWLNLPAGWSNRVSSTSHGCPRIRHFDGYWLVSPEETTLYPGGNLLALNNKASSIQYLP